MSRPAVPWPPVLEGTPAVSVIERAIGKRCLPHALLLSGDDPECLSAAGAALAERVLCRDPKLPRVHPDRHPDCFHLRPSGRSRQIKVDALRELIERINVTPAMSDSKVALLHEADRMNANSANAFLKTLEEPPADTTIVLLSSQPYSLLPTIRSRVLQFRFHEIAPPVAAADWAGWVADYRAWLGMLGKGLAGARGAADGVFGAYGLAARFGMILEAATDAELTRRKPLLPEGLEDDEIDAIEAEIGIGVRRGMFLGVEAATCAHANELMRAGDASAPRQLGAAVDALERVGGLLQVYLNPLAALEDFLLASLRIWARR